MTGKLGIVLGASTPDDVLALVVTQGFGGRAPHVVVRASATTRGTDLIPKLLEPAATIAPQLKRRDVQVYRVRAPLLGQSVIEARHPAGQSFAFAKTMPFGPRPRSLASRPMGLSVLLGSCTYYYPPLLRRLATRFTSGYGLGFAPSFSLLVGDNVYLDVPDPTNQTAADVVDRYLKYFLDGAYTAMRSQIPSFTTYDDHEFWNDYPRLALPVSLWLSNDDLKQFKPAALECLDLFQRSINPPSPQAQHGGLAYTIELDDLSFFVADTRTQRDDPDKASNVLMPASDLKALEDWAAGLSCPGVLVLGQPLWIEPIMKTGPVKSDHNISHFRQHYDRICTAIERAPQDVLVLTGDVHYSRLLSVAAANRRTFYEIASSPMISIPSDGGSLVNMLFGGWGAPMLEREIDDTKAAPRKGWGPQYMMGTGSGTSFAVVTFKRAGARVSVSLAFIDPRTGLPAAPADASPLGRASVLSPFPPHRGTSVARDVFSLGKRL